MLTKNDLHQIKGIVKEEVKPIKKQLDTVEMKVEVVTKRVDQLGGQLNQTERKLEKAIAKSQEETIEVLSDLIHEDTLQIANPQQ